MYQHILSAVEAHWCGEQLMRLLLCSAIGSLHPIHIPYESNIQASLMQIPIWEFAYCKLANT